MKLIKIKKLANLKNVWYYFNTIMRIFFEVIMAKEIDYEELEEFLSKLQSPKHNSKVLKILKILRGKWKLPVIYALFKK